MKYEIIIYGKSFKSAWHIIVLNINSINKKLSTKKINMPKLFY